jgi:hypothetical protein
MKLDARAHAAHFISTCFEGDDWAALFVKDVDGAVQRIGSIAQICRIVQSQRFSQDAAHRGVYISVNALAIGARSRSRTDVSKVRHVFLDVDQNAQGVLHQLERRSDLPAPSYVIHTSPGRAHILWRARDFCAVEVERLQRQLAATLGGDPAATAVTQVTRLPGFRNHKYDEPCLVWVEYRDANRAFTPRDFPALDGSDPVRPKPTHPEWPMHRDIGPAERARAYLSHVPPAVAGNHGDIHTFQTCCRIARGFALDDDQALAVLAGWNARCQPPWTQRELLQKIRSARRNGREPIGGLL